MEQYIIIENRRFKLTVGSNALVKSLIAKHSGEELLMQEQNIALRDELFLTPQTLETIGGNIAIPIDKRRYITSKLQILNLSYCLKTRN